MIAVEPRRGLRFLHARRIVGSPKAGTARPAPYVVTRVTAHEVFYKALDETDMPVGTPTSCQRSRFAEFVAQVLS